jgi:MFS family permease
MSTALTLALVQFVFALAWTIYVFFLPTLAQQAGIAKSVVWLILLLDQVLFALCDAACGAWLDRFRPALSHLLRVMLTLTLISALGFLALPWVAPAGSPLLMGGVLFVWATTSAALRVPPMLMLARFFPVNAFPRMASLSLLGLAIAGAFSSLLTLWLAGQDPRLPFALASVGLAVSVAMLLRCEAAREVAGVSDAPNKRAAQEPSVQNSAPLPMPWPWVVALALLAVGFQIHFFVNTAPAYLRFVPKESLPYVMPVFWLGFGLCMWAWGQFRWGERLLENASQGERGAKAMRAVVALALVGALIWLAIGVSTQFAVMLLLQGLGGVVWAAIFNLTLAWYADLGRTGHEGRSLGWFFSLLALAALMRIAMTGSGLAASPEIKPWLAWLPSTCFMLALAMLAKRKNYA